MKILAIETSCDETAIAILDCSGTEGHSTCSILGNALLSQTAVHQKYGGVFPTLAKREHEKNLVPILEAALEEAELLHEDTQVISEETRVTITSLFAREPGLTEQFFEFVSECEPPMINAIAVTTGPGLEPALWVGINFAQALALIWKKPVVAVNHMEGHILAALARQENAHLSIDDVGLPVLALLISGGHTELVLMKKWLSYELIGQTRDDAVGEAFDKVARMLSLPYPGGPEISKLAESLRRESTPERATFAIHLPRPMLHDETYDFSFAGLKTAVLYFLKANPNMRENEKKYVAREFENAVADVLWGKTSGALTHTQAKTLVIGGGVSANTHIRRVFSEEIKSIHPEVALRVPAVTLTTDNAIMIALAGYYRALRKEFATTLAARGTLPLA